MLKNNRIIPGDEVTRHFGGATRPNVYKIRPPSPTPTALIARSEAPERSVLNDDLNAIRGKLNPVKELQLLGRQNSGNDQVCILQPFYENYLVKISKLTI